MRPRERAIREQLRMIGHVCREYGVACIMNGDVKDRDEGAALAKEFGVDGGMIATAAESNSSAFRTREQGGLAPWREVVAEYLKLAMSVENKAGNTKFLLSQLIPGKDPVYQKVTMSKTYAQCCEVLELDEDMITRAREMDEILGLNDLSSKVQKKKEKNMSFKNKRKLQQGSNGSAQRSANNKRPKAREDTETARPSDFDSMSQVALAV